MYTCIHLQTQAQIMRQASATTNDRKTRLSHCAETRAHKSGNFILLFLFIDSFLSPCRFMWGNEFHWGREGVGFHPKTMVGEAPNTSGVFINMFTFIH